MLAKYSRDRLSRQYPRLLSNLSPCPPLLLRRDTGRESKPPNVLTGSFRGTKSLFENSSPSPLRERGTQGVRVTTIIRTQRGMGLLNKT